MNRDGYWHGETLTKILIGWSTLSEVSRPTAVIWGGNCARSHGLTFGNNTLRDAALRWDFDR